MGSKPTVSEAPTKEAIEELLIGGYKAAVLNAALDLEVWAQVAAGRTTALDIARHAGWEPTGVRRLLDLLCAMDLLAKDQCGYCLVPLAEYYLLPGKPTYIGNYLLKELAWESHGRLASAIRTGARPLAGEYTDEEMAAHWVEDYAPRRVAPEPRLLHVDALWQALRIEAHAGLRVLDVACGPGTDSLALARQHPGVQVTLLDLPVMLELALQIAAELGLEQQVTTLPGDLRLVDYGQEEYDVVWFGNILHFFDREDNITLLSRAFAALVPGGAVVIKAPLPDEARCKREFPLLVAMWLYTTSARGDAYTLSEYQHLLEQAGFAHVSEASEQLIKAMKPSQIS